MGPTAISKALFGDKTHRQKIQYHLDKLIEMKALHKIPGKNPAFYTKGSHWRRFENKIPNQKNGGPSGMVVRHDNETVNNHHNFFKFKVNKPADKCPPWDKCWCPNNIEAEIEKLKKVPAPSPRAQRTDIHRIWRFKPFEEWRDTDIKTKVTVKEDIGKNSHTVMVMLNPFETDDKEELESSDRILAGRAIIIGKMLQKLYGYELGLTQPERSGKGHYHIPIDKDVVEIAKQYGIGTKDVWFDDTPRPGMETNNKKRAVQWVQMPENIEELQTQYKEMSQVLMDLQEENKKLKGVINNMAQFDVQLLRFIQENVEAPIKELNKKLDEGGRRPGYHG